MYVSDFNSWHTNWGYKHSTQDGEFLAEWFSSSSIQRSTPLSSSAAGTPRPIQTWPLPKSPGMSCCRSGVSWTDSLAHNSRRTDHNAIVGPVDRGKAGPEMEFPQGQLGGLWESRQHGSRGPCQHPPTPTSMTSMKRTAKCCRRQETCPAGCQKELCPLLGRDV